MAQTVRLADYIVRSGWHGLTVASIVADLLNSDDIVIDIASADVLDAETVIGILRGWRHTQRDTAVNSLLEFGDLLAANEKAEAIVLEELAKTMATLTAPDHSDRIRGLLDRIVSRYPELASTCRSSLLQMLCRARDDEEKGDWAIRVGSESKALPWQEHADVVCGPCAAPSSSITICQLSDIHFGKFHAYDLEEHGEQTYTGPTADLPGFIKNRLKRIPDYYVVCGDIGSDKAEDLDYFAHFASQLPVSEGDIKQRMFVVPGNHDVIWAGKTNDRLDSFKKRIAELGFRTPFGTDGESITTDSDGCPASIYVDTDAGVIFLLLTSCYYSGDMESRIGSVLEKLRIDADTLDQAQMDRIRAEYGYIHEGYLSAIEDLLQECQARIGDKTFLASRKLAAIHHHFEDVGYEAQITHGGARLQELLNEYDFGAILHGHVHTHYLGSVHGQKTQALACPSLSGRCKVDSNGFHMLHMPNDGADFINGSRYQLKSARFGKKPVSFTIQRRVVDP